MIRYLPPKGTAGLARSRVSGNSRVPFAAREYDSQYPKVQSSFHGES